MRIISSGYQDISSLGSSAGIFMNDLKLCFKLKLIKINYCYKKHFYFKFKCALGIYSFLIFELHLLFVILTNTVTSSTTKSAVQVDSQPSTCILHLIKDF